MILAPSASASLSTTVLGDTDMTLMRIHFVKPQAIVSMSFSEDRSWARLRPVYRIGSCDAGDTAVHDADRIAALKHVVIAGRKPRRVFALDDPEIHLQREFPED